MWDSSPSRGAWSGVEMASCSADPAPGHQVAERFSGASVDKHVACKKKRLLCLTLHEGAHPNDKIEFSASAKTRVFA